MRTIAIAFLIIYLSPAAQPCSCITVDSFPTRTVDQPPSAEELRQRVLEINKHKLTVKITLDHSEYRTGQAVEAKVSVTNPTEERIQVWEPFDSGQMIYVSPGEYPCYCGRSGKARWLEAGETVEQTYRSKK